MQRGFKFQGGPVSTYGGHYQLNLIYFNEKQFYFWRPALFAVQWNHDGNQNGLILCQSVHGEIIRERPLWVTQRTYLLGGGILMMFSPYGQTFFILLSSLPPSGPRTPWRSSTHGSSTTRDVSLQIFIQNLRRPTNTSTAIAVIHPTVKKSIAYSQALRLRRICHQDRDYQRHFNNLKTYFVQRGYEDEEVQLKIGPLG